MTSSRKPTAGFWITVALLAVLVGYPLSWGPAWWLVATVRISLPMKKQLYTCLVSCVAGGRCSRLAENVIYAV